MIYNGFYPTSSRGCEALTNGLTGLRGAKILDPSAGKGDILDYVRNHSSHSAYQKYDQYGKIKEFHKNYYAMEINPELRAILNDKLYKVIGTDFLAYSGHQYFDFILMNPPFDRGATHLLKAFEIANGAVIRCLLNSETLSNPHTQERKRLTSLIEKHGWTKELGPIFKNAERKTSANVVLVHLEDSRQKERFRLDFDPEIATPGDFDLDDIQENSLALGNIFDSYESRFNAAVEAFKELLVARQKVQYYLEPLTLEHTSSIYIIGKALSENRLTARDSYENFLEAITEAAWGHLFDKTKLGDVTTKGVRDEVSNLQHNQGVMAFSAGNMEDLFHTLFMNRENVMMQCILEVFDNLTLHHKENREHVEGWKTNSSYKIGKKFILPGIGSHYQSSPIDYAEKLELEDIEKAMSFLSGKRFEHIQHITDVYQAKSYFGQWMRSEFFDTKLFKRGTMHFRWRNPHLREEFNAVVARQRWGEIPEKTKSGAFV